MLGGRGEFVEKYLETAEDLRSRGFSVWSMDWRGQGLSRGPETGVRARGRAHYERWIDDLDLLIGTVTAQTGAPPVAALAHSMGGLVLLRHAAERPTPLRAVVLTAPLIAPLASAVPRRLARVLAALAVRLELGHVYALGQHDFRAGAERLRFRITTSDPERFARSARLLAERPDLRLGGVTWGWLDSSFRACRQLGALAASGRLRLPVMIAAAGREKLVGIGAQRRFARLVPGTRLHVYRDSRHEILMERDEIRAAFWRDFDAFLAVQGI